jgi:hypothetical protein
VPAPVGMKQPRAKDDQGEGTTAPRYRTASACGFPGPNLSTRLRRGPREALGRQEDGEAGTTDEAAGVLPG